MKKPIDNFPPIVTKALQDHITNWGQLTDEEIKTLERHVKLGVLVHGADMNYSPPKSVG